MSTKKTPQSGSNGLPPANAPCRSTIGPLAERPRRHPRDPARRHARLPPCSRRHPEEVQSPPQHQAQGRVLQDDARPAEALRELLRELRHHTPYRNLDLPTTGQPTHRSDGGTLGRARPVDRDPSQLLELPADLRRLDRQGRDGAGAQVLRRLRITPRTPGPGGDDRPQLEGPKEWTSPPRSRRSTSSTPGCDAADLCDHFGMRAKEARHFRRTVRSFTATPPTRVTPQRFPSASGSCGSATAPRGVDRATCR
jgi:hypothetical protein